MRETPLGLSEELQQRREANVKVLAAVVVDTLGLACNWLSIFFLQPQLSISPLSRNTTASKNTHQCAGQHNVQAVAQIWPRTGFHLDSKGDVTSISRNPLNDKLTHIFTYAHSHTRPYLH